MSAENIVDLDLFEPKNVESGLCELDRVGVSKRVR